MLIALVHTRAIQFFFKNLGIKLSNFYKPILHLVANSDSTGVLKLLNKLYLYSKFKTSVKSEIATKCKMFLVKDA